MLRNQCYSCVHEEVCRWGGLILTWEGNRIHFRSHHCHMGQPMHYNLCQYIMSTTVRHRDSRTCGLCSTDLWKWECSYKPMQFAAYLLEPCCKMDFSPPKDKLCPVDLGKEDREKKKHNGERNNVSKCAARPERASEYAKTRVAAIQPKDGGSPRSF